MSQGSVPFFLGPGAVVAMAGTRHLDIAGAVLVSGVVADLIGAGASLVVGCAVGADAAVLSAIGRDLRGRVTAYAAFGPVSPSWEAPQGRYSAPGACAVSALSCVAAHARAGGSVVWWAGGGPHVPVKARLSHRTRAVVASATGCAVLFFGPGRSIGTGLAGRTAAARGLPVFAFDLGSSVAGPPSLGAGAWVRVCGSGWWAYAWHWVPAQAGCA